MRLLFLSVLLLASSGCVTRTHIRETRTGPNQASEMPTASTAREQIYPFPAIYENTPIGDILPQKFDTSSAFDHWRAHSKEARGIYPADYGGLKWHVVLLGPAGSHHDFALAAYASKGPKTRLIYVNNLVELGMDLPPNLEARIDGKSLRLNASARTLLTINFEKAIAAAKAAL